MKNNSNRRKDEEMQQYPTQYSNRPSHKDEGGSHNGRNSMDNPSGNVRDGSYRSECNEDAFGDFPPQMMQSTSTKHDDNGIYNRTKSQKTTRFAMDEEITTNRTSALNLGSTKKVLILESKENKQSNQRQKVTSTPMPNRALESSACLDFSMIATPGGAKLARMVNDDGGDTASLRSEGTASSVVSSGLWVTGTPFGSLLRGVVSSTPGIHPRKLLSGTPYTAAREALSRNEDNQSARDDEIDDHECTALMFARSAPLSGYLRKLGKNIPKFKRRFFVLKPSTHLYYFMSPTDVEPRGCIDLDLTREHGEGGGCEVREIGVLPDGTFRFELLFDEEIDEDELNTSFGTYDDASDTGSRTSYGSKKREFQRQSVVLEARTEEIGREWMSKLQSERLSTARDEIDFLKTTLAETKATSSRWESSAYEEGLRAEEAEKSRDLAISEAQAWEAKFHDLKEAVRLLANSAQSVERISRGDEAITDFQSDENRALEGLDIRDTQIQQVSQVLQNIQQNYSQAREDAEKANKRAEELEQRAIDAETRLAKMEAELCQVWEDNCSIQKDLKKVRREKKILVKEVRSLHAAADETKSKELNQLRPEAQDRTVASDNCASSTKSRTDASKCDGSERTLSNLPKQRKLLEEERRLVIELEEHVMSGLRLSEQFLTLNGIEPSVVDDDHDSICQASKASINRTPERQPDLNSSRISVDNIFSAKTEKANNEKANLHVPREQPLGSLLDDASLQNDESDASEDGSQDQENIANSTTVNLTSATEFNNYKTKEVRSHDDNLPTERPINQNLYHRFETCEDGRIRDRSDNDAESLHSTKSIIDRQRTTMPTQQIEENSVKRTPSVDMTSSVSESERSRVTDNGQATTKLECTLRDVGETPNSTRPRSSLGDDGKVYHITFYSSKIGLQFQKVPNDSTSGGLLTDAMTADHGPFSEREELRRIAAISQQSRSQKSSNQRDFSVECLPATPVDAVLVCGFVGFDESTGNVRPRIGARLVAFDGIPVEVGKWTFESIRKSIQARGRPLTLSFRNDFLTPKQRAILTNAVDDINAFASSQHPPHNSMGNRKQDHLIDNETESITSTSTTSSRNQFQRNKYYSFSEAGSSISSAVAPLMSNLMTGLSNGKKSRHEPEYLRRQTDSLEKMRHHHDFKSGLL